MLDVPLHRSSENRAFNVAPYRRTILDAHRVIDARHVLFDDRAFVEILSDVVRRRTDQLHSAVVRLLIWLGALENSAGTSDEC